MVELLFLNPVLTLFILSLVLLPFILFTVQQQTAAIVQRFGRFVRVARAGLNIKIPFIDTIAGYVSLRVQQLDIDVETKTQDNVFVNINVSVQYQVIQNKVFDAFYRLERPEAQITSFVYDVVRARVPSIKLDDVFEKKDDIADAVKTELEKVMDEFGYTIIKALVTNVEPDAKVKASMNEINAAQRLRVAANEKGEADKILMVKAAEAESESKILQGKGIAGQRKAIVDGLRDSIADFKTTVKDTSAADVMNMVLMTQYFDTLKDIGASSKTNTILIPHTPGHLKELSDQLRDSTIVGNLVNATELAEARNGSKTM